MYSVHALLHDHTFVLSGDKCKAFIFEDVVLIVLQEYRAILLSTMKIAIKYHKYFINFNLLLDPPTRSHSKSITK